MGRHERNLRRGFTVSALSFKRSVFLLCGDWIVSRSHGRGGGQLGGHCNDPSAGGLWGVDLSGGGGAEETLTDLGHALDGDMTVEN